MSSKRPPAVPLLALSSVLFGAMALAAKLASPRLPGSEIAFVRFLIGLVAVLLVATRVKLRVGNGRGLMLRGVLGGVAVLCFFSAIQHLPVGLATLLNYTSPIFTVLWAALFLDERIGAAALGALAVTSIGVGLVIKSDAGPGGFSFWVLVGVFGSITSGAAVATIREVRRTDGSWEIFGSFCAVGALVTAVPALRGWVRPDAHDWLLLTAVGLLALGGQLLMTWALRYLKAGIAGILMQLTPASAIVLGWLALGEKTAALALIGAAITVSGVVWGARIEAKEEPPPGPKTSTGAY